MNYNFTRTHKARNCQQ